MAKKKIVTLGTPTFLIECPKLDREAKAEFSDSYISCFSDYGCDCCGSREHEIEVYLKCECGETHTWGLPW
jgi:hypothetical protein